MPVQKEDTTNMTTTVAPAVQQPEPKAPATANAGALARLKRFIREVLVELKKTNWPTRDELTKYTIVVMITIVLVAAYLYVSDVVAFSFTKWVGITPK